jgi:transposase
MRRIYSFYISTPDGFLDFLKTCADIYSYHVEWAFENKSTNKVKAHQDLYQKLRSLYPDIPAKALGKQVVKVDARYTSQKCSNCRIIEKSNRNKSRYICSRCGYIEHADINAAKNIKTNYFLSLAEKNNEQAVVNQPNAAKTNVLSSKPTTLFVGY